MSAAARRAAATGSALDAQSRKWLVDLLKAAVCFDEPMARHTSLRVGGVADAFAAPGNCGQMAALIDGGRRRAIPVFVVGRGTNLLVRDGGIRGLVISTAGLRGIRLAAVPDAAGHRQVTAMAGDRLPALCRFALQHALDGLNFAVGIPGSVGGAIAMNAGAAGGSISQVLTAVRMLTAKGRVVRMVREALHFGYRRLEILSQVPTGSGQWPLILEGTFSLPPGDRRALKKDAMKRIRMRRATQPLTAASAGCIFRNPPGPSAAGALIERAGLKGKRIGGACISPLHANFIINTGHATATDVLALMATIQETVWKRCGVRLQPEVVIVGE